MATAMATIVCNGPSRKIDPIPEFLNRHIDRTYIMNAAYRDGLPYDYLCAMDRPIISEIMNSGVDQNKILIPEYEEQYEPLDYCANAYHRADDGSIVRPRYNIGMWAMEHAIKNDCKILNIVGFDSLFLDANSAVANVYEGTACYGSETNLTINSSRRRLYLLVWMMKKYHGIMFNFMFAKKSGPDIINLTPHASNFFLDIIT